MLTIADRWLSDQWTLSFFKSSLSIPSTDLLSAKRKNPKICEKKQKGKIGRTSLVTSTVSTPLRGEGGEQGVPRKGN